MGLVAVYRQESLCREIYKEFHRDAGQAHEVWGVYISLNWSVSVICLETGRNFLGILGILTFLLILEISAPHAFFSLNLFTDSLHVKF